MSAISIAERAILERDRIARQKRRNTVIENDIIQKKLKTSHEKAPDNDVIEISDDESPGTSTGISSRPVTRGGTTHEERFWHGESRSVRNQLVDNPDATFSLDEIVGKDDLNLVIAASFCWEMDWFAQHFPDPRQLQTIILTQPTNESNGRVREADAHSEGFKAGSVVSFAFLPGGYGCQHMKFLLLFYKSGRLRVVVTSANMRSADWYVMDNTAFVQDLLPLNKPTCDDPTTHAWPIQLHHLIKHSRIDQALRHLQKRNPNLTEYGDSFLHKWDWSKVKALLIMSLPGSHVGTADGLGLGMLGIAQQIKSAGWTPEKGETVLAEYQSSSLCRLTAKWAHHMHACFSGRSVEELSKMGIPIDVSLLGREGGGSMFCTAAHFTSDTKPFFADAVCKYGGLLMHTKMIICLFRSTNSLPLKASAPSQTSTGGWAYVAGSHNLSQAAWGHLSFVKGEPKIYIKNYELGVILPISRENREIEASRIATWERPPRSYTSTDTPFMQTLHMTA